MVTLDKVFDAQRVLKDIITETKLQKANKIAPDCDLYLKPECLQKTGSFKLRGSGYKIAGLSEEEKKRGVVACSAGNHSQGVALAATKLGIPSYICMPDGAPISKVEATKGFGAQVTLVPGVYDDAYRKALEMRDEFGYTLVHPFDDEDVIAGQGTIGLEILADNSDIDAVIVPIGGGGLISGISYAIKSLRPSVKVYGVQAEGAASMFRSVNSGKIQCLDSVSTIADGIAVKQPGVNTFDMVSKYVDDIVTVSEDEICSAILALIERQKMVAEGAGAVSVAAAMFNKRPIQGKKVVSDVSGGNIDVTSLSRVIQRGLMKSGRSTRLVLELMDKPGQLTTVSGIISALGGNVIGVRHERTAATRSVNGCYLTVEMETRNYAHVEEIVTALKGAGFNIIED
ncbi:MAG: threonine ammonia-lyase [Clostridia bacterium]|nr:threonine ammonia-lyase [Clostridia bacterium]